METFGTRPRNRTTNEKPCKFCNAPNWDCSHKCPALDKLSNNCGRKGLYAQACRQKENNKRRIRNVTEEDTTMIGNELNNQNQASTGLRRSIVLPTKSNT